MRHSHSYVVRSRIAALCGIFALILRCEEARMPRKDRSFHSLRIAHQGRCFMLSEFRRRHQVSNPVIRFEDVTFRTHIVEHERSTFLGYADATLVCGDLKLRIRGIQVKLLNGSPRMDLPQERGNDGKWYPIMFPKSAETRTALTNALFADAAISAVALTVLEQEVSVDAS